MAISEDRPQINGDAVDRISRLQNTIDSVVNLIHDYGWIDGGHHKHWVLDQILREILKEEYDHIMQIWEGDPESEDYFEWEVGTPP